MYADHGEVLKSSLGSDAGHASPDDVAAAKAELGRSTPGTVCSSSGADVGGGGGGSTLSTLAMIILSYNKNDARLAIDNVRQGS